MPVNFQLQVDTSKPEDDGEIERKSSTTDSLPCMRSKDFKYPKGSADFIMVDSETQTGLEPDETSDDSVSDSDASQGEPERKPMFARLPMTGGSFNKNTTKPDKVKCSECGNPYTPSDTTT